MPLHPEFPTSPHVILDPEVRWYPGEEELSDDGRAKLMPPLVSVIRERVQRWRTAGYPGTSGTSAALLRHWFGDRHVVEGPDGETHEFQYYFAQREAVETAIWLYEVERARDGYSLLRYDSSGRVSTGMFEANWPRYVFKLATGAGKTKVLSLLIAWSYFHRLYEPDSPLSKNILLIAPNIIVLDRLHEDFGGLKIFRQDPVLPENGHSGRNWRDDFQLTLHVQDQVSTVTDSGNLFLTNIHRVYDAPPPPTLESDNLLDFFAGKRPTGKTNENDVDLGEIVRDVDDLVVLNDEAHHIHDSSLAWWRAIEDIDAKLRQKGGQLSAQFDVTATPKHQNGAIFVETVCSYPLVEAIRQGVVKTPVVPDEASRAKLTVRPSDDITEQYRDHIDLGFREWKDRYENLQEVGQKAVLFVMTTTTAESDEVAEYLETTYPDLTGGVLVIHTNKDGSISEAASKEAELQELRRAAREIDDPASPYKAVVSVLMLREGWDVKNVVAMVGLRPFTAEAKILPEQTLGRGLRRMFRSDPDLTEYVSVVGTDEFLDFVESIKVEGVELERVSMGANNPPKQPVIVEVDDRDPDKDIERLDIELPVLTPRIQREYKNLEQIDVSAMPGGDFPLQEFSPAEQREIAFRDVVDGEEILWTTDLGADVIPSPQALISYLTNTLVRQLRLVGGQDVLFGKLKAYIRERLFDTEVELDDLNVLRNLSEPAPRRHLLGVFVDAINSLTVQDSGATAIADTIKMSKVRPHVVSNQPYLIPKKSVMNKVVGDSQLELDFAGFLDGCADIVSFVRNTRNTHFKIEYVNADGTISHYYPDFVVKAAENELWVIETKGLEDLDVLPKWQRLKQWCVDATRLDPARRTFRSMFVPQDDFVQYNPKSWSQAVSLFEDAEPTAPPVVDLAADTPGDYAGPDAAQDAVGGPST
jgi:type III restriction enzyme